MELGRTHADVAGTFGNGEQVRAGRLEELDEGVAQRVIKNPTPFARGLLRPLVPVVDVVQQITESHVGERTAHQALDVGQQGGVAAEEAMLAEDPQVPGTRGALLRQGGRVVRVSQTLARLPGQQLRELVGVEAGQIEIKAVELKITELELEKFIVPLGVLVRAVVHQPVGARLRGRQALGDMDRHRLKAQCLGGIEPGVPDDGQRSSESTGAWLPVAETPGDRRFLDHPGNRRGREHQPVLRQPGATHDAAGARNRGSDTGRKAAGGPDDGEGHAALSAGMETPDNVNF